MKSYESFSLLTRKIFCTTDVSLLLHPFNGLFSRTTWVGRHQQGKPFWILLEQEMIRWQWHQLNHMQIICTLLQTDNHACASPLSFYRPDALPATQWATSKHWRVRINRKAGQWNTRKWSLNQCYVYVTESRCQHPGVQNTTHDVNCTYASSASAFSNPRPVYSPAPVWRPLFPRQPG